MRIDLLRYENRRKESMNKKKRRRGIKQKKIFVRRDLSGILTEIISFGRLERD